MKIGIDIDGVLTDEHGYIIDNGTRFFSEKNIPYILHKNIYDSKEIFEVTGEQYNEFWKEHLLEYSKNTPIRPFAAEIIDKLKKEGNQIYIITSRSFTTYENEYKDMMQGVVKEWLSKNNVNYDYIVFTDTKAKVCEELNIDIMIEDKPENIESVSKQIPVICYDHPYNDKMDGNNIIRGYSWYDIYNKIKVLKKY